MPVTPAPEEIYSAVSRLVEEGQAIDEVISNNLESIEPEQLAQLMELKRRVTRALFTIVSQAMESNPDRREDLLSMLAAFRCSHARAEAALTRGTQTLNGQLQGLWRRRQAANRYAERESLRRAC